MQGIPPVKDTDAEDVVWGLQTAEALWKRGERGDALVWLRRAAQAAGDANDDDRALELARIAAELTDSGEANAPGAPKAAASAMQPPSGPPPQVSQPPAAAAPVPFVPPVPAARGPLPSVPTGKLSKPPLPRPKVSKAPSPPFASKPVAQPSTPRPPEPAFPPPEHARPQPPRASLPSQPTVETAVPAFPPEEPDEHAHSVLPADRVHAGMYNPWDPANGAPSQPEAPARADDRFSAEEDEVITSVNLSALRASGGPDMRASERPEAPKPRPPSDPPVRTSASPPKPPPLPPRAKAATRPPPSEIRARPEAPTRPAIDVVADAAAKAVRSEPPQPPPNERVTRADRADVMARAKQDEPEPPKVEPGLPKMEETLAVGTPHIRPSEAPRDDARPPALDLEGVEAFADLPDDARAAFAAAATVSRLAEGEEVSRFALAYVVSGSLDVAATMVDAPASRLEEGAVLRARGTTEEGVPMRLICAGGFAVVATWSDQAVEEAFRTCPWVEDDLRAAADKVQTLVGITIGPLGERLDASLREQIVGRLTMRPLLAGELVVSGGQPVPGLFLVGVGELELVEGDAVKGTVGSGDFLFASAVLGAGAAPQTARAGAGGALVLYGDRNVAQELLVTCPPLLEVFAGM